MRKKLTLKNYITKKGIKLYKEKRVLILQKKWLL
jgi:hypothetical protein